MSDDSPKSRGKGMRRTPLKRKRPTVRTSKGLFEGRVREKKGLFQKKQSKVEEWDEARERLRKRFALAGIDSCELSLVGCTGKRFWSFAHSLKRRHWSTEPEQRKKDLEEVIFACTNCHQRIENLGNKGGEGRLTMAEVVRAVIARRRKKV